MLAQEWMDGTFGKMKRGSAPVPSVPRIIGITGVAGSGKDTIAAHLRYRYGHRVLRFADPIKLALEVMFGLSPFVWEDRTAKEREIPWLGVSPRRLAQTLGSEWGRELVHPEVWAKVLERKLIANPGVSVVIPDVRFDNEAAMLRNYGGVVLRVLRPDAPGVAHHSSERGVSESLIDHTFVNYTVAALLLEVDRWVVQ